MHGMHALMTVMGIAEMGASLADPDPDHGRIPHCGNRPTSTLICSYMNNISILLRKGSSPKMDECLE